MKSVLNSKPSWLARKMILSVTLASLTLTSALAEAQMRGGPGGGRGPGGGGDREGSRPEPFNPGRGDNRGNDRGNRGGGRDDRGGRNEPPRPSEPSRPNRPSEPSRPNYPGNGGRDDNRPGNGGGRRDHGGYERDNRRNERSSWNNRYRVNPPSYRRPGYRDQSTWSSRYDRWWSGASRPGYYAPVQRIRWHRPMPAPGYWRYADVEQIADNLEYVSRDVYDSMDRVALQNEYGLRLRRVLAGLIDATENFNDSVNDRYDWSDSINDLFYLESQLDLAEQTLDGYSQSWRVQEEMGSLRYYVNELLWTYRQNF